MIGLRAEWPHAERCNIERLQYNVCGRSDIEGAGRLGLPLYSCACLKHTHSQHQLLVLVVLRQLLARSHRDLVDIVEMMTPLPRRLRLMHMPHFTTLHKFSMHLKTHALDRLLRRRQLLVLDEQLYRRRALVETVNSMLKRLSSVVRARSGRGQYAEMALRAAAHNARRATLLAREG